MKFNIDNILKTRLGIVDELYVIDSLHTHIGKLFSEWSVIEKTMGDGLQVMYYCDWYYFWNGAWKLIPRRFVRRIFFRINYVVGFHS